MPLKPASQPIDPSLKAKIEAWRLTDPRNDFLDDELCLKWMEKEEKERKAEEKRVKEAKEPKASQSAKGFKYDKTKDGWKLLEDVPPSTRRPFTPEFVKFLKPGESSINGDLMRQRAKELKANLGQRDLEWLLDNQHLIPESERGYYLVATGTVWRYSGGGRDVPYLCWFGGRWCLGFGWLGSGWGGGGCLVRVRE